VKLVAALAVASASFLVAGGAAAAPVHLVEAGGAQFPFRSYILTLPTRQALPLSRLHVSENGTPVRALSVVSAQAAKQREFGVVLAIDASLSMKGKPIRAAMEAARAFAAHRAPTQELAVITFNGGIHVVQPLTASSSAITAALSRAPKLGYGTKIYDALQTAETMLVGAHVQGASIVLLSDGADVGSAAKPAAVLRSLAGEHVRTFTVGLTSKTFRQANLVAVAAATKGTYLRAAGPAALRPIYDALGTQLSNEYLISYQSLAGPGAHMRVTASVDGLAGVATSAYVTPSLHIKAAPPYHASLGSRILQSWITMLFVALLAAAAFGFTIRALATPRRGGIVDRVASFVSIRRRPDEAQAEGDQAADRRVDLLRGAEGALERLRWWPRFRATLELADINASPTQIVLLTLLATAGVMMLLYLVLGVAGVFLGLGTPLAARGIIRVKLARKRRAFAEQLPDNLEVMAAALRAGHSLVGALAAVIDSAPEPAQSEFRRVIAEEQLGVPLEEALGTVVERMDNRDLDQVALVARLQRETGAGAAEVIDRVIETVRARQELRRLVRTLTAQGRLSRWILTALPVVLALALPLINHGYLDPLLHKGSGQALLVVTVLMVTAGSFVIGKIVDIKV
jgi:tight adherence protein B